MPIQSKQQPPYYQQGINEKSCILAISQNGTGQLTITEHKNTIGPITIPRQGVGWFLITCTGQFTEGKTWIANSDGFGYAAYPISSSDVNAEFYAFKIGGTDTIDLQFFDANYDNVDPSTLFGNDFVLQLPEIKVFK